MKHWSGDEVITLFHTFKWRKKSWILTFINGGLWCLISSKLHIWMQMKISSINHCFTLHTVHILTVVQGISSLNFHLRLGGAVSRLLNTFQTEENELVLYWFSCCGEMMSTEISISELQRERCLIRQNDLLRVHKREATCSTEKSFYLTIACGKDQVIADRCRRLAGNGAGR